MTSANLVGTANVADIISFTISEAGSHYLYFKHCNTQKHFYGLIYAMKCKPCEGKKGGIIASVHCAVQNTIQPANGVEIDIYKSPPHSATDTPIWTGITGSGTYPPGTIDTCFNLEPGNYEIVPTNYNNTICRRGTITPSSQVVTVNPGEKAKVGFRCRCCFEGGEEGGRIIVSMPKECLPGTTVYIYSMDGVEVWHGTANNQGIFDTGENPCILKCPARYKVVPKNERCKFYPESADVSVPCCPSVAKIEFKCECRGQGREEIRLEIAI